MRVKATSAQQPVCALISHRFKKRLRNVAAENKIERSKGGHRNSVAPDLATKQTS